MNATTDAAPRTPAAPALTQATTLLDPASPAADAGIGPRTPAAPAPVRGHDRLRLLGEVTLFRELRPDELAPLAQATEVVTFDPGDTIVRQGDPGDSVYVVVGGRVQVLARIERDGISTESVISWLGPGETLGELSLLDGQPRSATCVALVATTCLRLGRDEFLAALRRHWRLTRALLGVLAERLRFGNERLAEHARDPLTGLYSRAALAELYKREVARAQRTLRCGGNPRPLAVLYADVDRFKEINDRHGHQTGDAVLRGVAKTLSAVTRATDVAARLGGDEFVVLLAEAGVEGGGLVAGRLRRLLEQRPPGPVPFSLSIGTALVDPVAPAPLDEMLHAADRAMYADKTRNT